jgi:hypothetical protein
MKLMGATYPSIEVAGALKNPNSKILVSGRHQARCCGQGIPALKQGISRPFSGCHSHCQRDKQQTSYGNREKDGVLRAETPSNRPGGRNDV